MIIYTSVLVFMRAMRMKIIKWMNIYARECMVYLLLYIVYEPCVHLSLL